LAISACAPGELGLALGALLAQRGALRLVLGDRAAHERLFGPHDVLGRAGGGDESRAPRQVAEQRVVARLEHLRRDQRLGALRLVGAGQRRVELEQQLALAHELPLRTWIARTAPISIGWISLMLPAGTVLPGPTGDHVDPAQHRPQQREHEQPAGQPQQPAQPGARRGLHDLERSGKELVLLARPEGPVGRFWSRQLSRTTCQWRAIVGKRSASALMPRLPRGPSAWRGAGRSARPPEQLGVPAHLGHLAGLDGDDPVTRAHRREAMGDDQHRAAAGDLLQVGLDDLLALGVERAGRLVEDQDPRIGDQRAGDRERWRWPPERLAPRSSMSVS
jgi:hypothetical protein